MGLNAACDPWNIVLPNLGMFFLGVALSYLAFAGDEMYAKFKARKERRMATCCPECKGTGFIRGFEARNADNIPSELRENYKCIRCHGARVITEEQQNWIKEGSALLAARVRVGMSLRQGAARLGLASSTLLSMEQGYSDPSRALERVWRYTKPWRQK